MVFVALQLVTHTLKHIQLQPLLSDDLLLLLHLVLSQLKLIGRLVDSLLELLHEVVLDADFSIK